MKIMNLKKLKILKILNIKRKIVYKIKKLKGSYSTSVL